MKTAIYYYSKHHGNTLKLVEAIHNAHPDVDVFDVTSIRKSCEEANKEGHQTISGLDMTQYDRIGFASGIYYGDFAKQVLALMECGLPDQKEVFGLFSCGANPTKKFTKHIREIVEAKKGKYLGDYGCSGFDTFGPFKLVGGLKKGHPTEDEIQGAVTFYEGL